MKTLTGIEEDEHAEVVILVGLHSHVLTLADERLHALNGLHGGLVRGGATVHLRGFWFGS